MNPSNHALVLATKNFINLIKFNVRIILTTSIFFLFLGILYTFSLSPKFEIYAEILPKEEENFSMQQNNSLVSMLSQNSEKNDLSFFQSKMYSSSVSRTLWDMGYDKVFFADSFNPISNSYQLKPTAWQKIKSKILGYEININIDHQNFSDFIEGAFEIRTDKKTSSTFLFTRQVNPNLYLNLLEDLLYVTDNSIKQDKLKDISGRIQFLTEKIKTTSEVPVQTNLMLLLEKTLLQEVLLSDESYYSVTVVDEPQISKDPSFINLQFIYSGFFILGFLISIIYIFIRQLFLDNQN